MTTPPTPPPFVPLYHPWCPADRPYPVSHAAAIAADPDLCVAVDPCLPDGTTLWHYQPCTPAVAVGTPPVPPTRHLPATGGADIGPAAVVLTVGVALALIARRGSTWSQP